MNSRPSLAVSIATALKSRAEDRGFLAYVPFVFAGCLALGFCAAEFLPDDFWADESWGVSTAVFGGLLAFNGLLMSLGWFAFSKIYEILANDRLGQMLTRNNLLGVHLAFIDVTHLVLIAASVLSALGLVATLTDLPIWLDRPLLGICLGFTLYSICRAYSATKMMNDLVWEQAHLDRGGSNVTPMAGSPRSQQSKD